MAGAAATISPLAAAVLGARLHQLLAALVVLALAATAVLAAAAALAAAITRNRAATAVTVVAAAADLRRWRRWRFWRRRRRRLGQRWARLAFWPGPAGLATAAAAPQAALGAAVFVRQGAALHITGGSFTGGLVTGGAGQDGGGSGSGVGTALFLAGSTTYTVNAGETITIAGAIGGGVHPLITGGLTKAGGGALILTDNNNNYTGPTAVASGTLTVNGALLGSATVTVGSGGRLNGAGSVSGSVAVQAGGELAPGASPGILDTGSVTLSAGSRSAWRLRAQRLAQAMINSTSPVLSLWAMPP